MKAGRRGSIPLLYLDYFGPDMMLAIDNAAIMRLLKVSTQTLQTRPINRQLITPVSAVINSGCRGRLSDSRKTKEAQGRQHPHPAG